MAQQFLSCLLFCGTLHCGTKIVIDATTVIQAKIAKAITELMKHIEDAKKLAKDDKKKLECVDNVEFYLEELKGDIENS